MRTGRRSLAIAASIALSAPALVADGLAQEPAGEGDRAAVVDGPAALAPGRRCRVETTPVSRWFGTVRQTFEGKVVKADDRGVTLRVDTFHRDADASNIPLVGRAVKERGVGRTRPGEAFEVRIPAEKIRKAELLGD